MTTDPATTLAACLPKDPADTTTGIGVPTNAVRDVLAELVEHRRTQTDPFRPTLSPAEDGGT